MPAAVAVAEIPPEEQELYPTEVAAVAVAEIHLVE
jgi:hypothetical protein